MRLTIDRLESDRAVLRTEDGQELIIPRSKLPPNAREKDTVTASFGGNAETIEKRSQQAKDILNEILDESG